jgi:hypothetical protein
MPYRYKIDGEKRTVLVSFSGRSSMNEAIELRRKLARDPLFASSHNQLVDLSRLIASSSGFDDFASHGGDLDPFSPASRRAIAAPTDFSYGMARMYVSLREDPAKFAIFRSVALACCWLGLEEAGVRPFLDSDREEPSPA